jgi:SAM-dependent methyltransferase
LEVFFCSDCTLVQLCHVVSPEVLFSHYLYRTGTNTTIFEHNQALAEKVTQVLRLTSQDLVSEVASNDGSLLSCFRQRGIRVLGVDPARNIAELARLAGVETWPEFFDQRVAERIRQEKGPARVLIANNVLAHVDDPVGFLSACRSAVASNGFVVVEVPYLAEMLERLEYDTIYHEHLCYFSLTALVHLFERAGLRLHRVERIPIHGGSLRLWASASQPDGKDDSVQMLLTQERACGLNRLDPYCEFACRVERNRRHLTGLLADLKQQGRTVAAYGAPAKGTTLLSYCGLTTEQIPYTVDRSELKVGKLTPGSHVPILPVETILQRQPDFVLILAWNFAEEIMDFLQPYRARGGRFILPIPEPKIL